MSSLLEALGISIPLDQDQGAKSVTMPVFDDVDGCIVLKSELQRAQHVKTSDFQDRTGYECFINHVHFPFARTRESLLSCLRYAAVLQDGLAQLQPRRHFRTIVSVRDGDCTVRFHEDRPGESWVADDLEVYTEEAVLVLEGG